nr:uncharacterized protein CTRU02_08382 [Colletotrichum truncatum]KAF6790253.1 hypothetical protein CTRU02_08382 [Colletotrichum truncatum]
MKSYGIRKFKFWQPTEISHLYLKFNILSRFLSCRYKLNRRYNTVTSQLGFQPARQHEVFRRNLSSFRHCGIGSVLHWQRAPKLPGQQNQVLQPRQKQCVRFHGLLSSKMCQCCRWSQLSIV